MPYLTCLFLQFNMVSEIYWNTSIPDYIFNNFTRSGNYST